MKKVRSGGEISKKVSFGYTPKAESSGSNNEEFSDGNSSHNISDSSGSRSNKLWKKKKFSFVHRQTRSGEWAGNLLASAGLPRRHSEQNSTENGEEGTEKNRRTSSDGARANSGSSNKDGERKERSFSLFQPKTARPAAAKALSRSVNAYDYDSYSHDSNDRRSSKGSSNGGNNPTDDVSAMSSRKSVLRRENIDANAMTMGMDEISANFLDFLSEAKCRDWLKSLSRRDPRYCIKAFFDDVAKDGADNIEKEHGFQPELLSPLLSMFQRSSVFSVWRPTSVDSIRKMMTGQGTGKGLDIKGKSAKKGKLSAYVPFLQIHDDAHKTKIRPLARDERIRVFYKKREARNLARITLLEIMNDMVKQVGNAERELQFVHQPTKQRNRRVTTGEHGRPSASQLRHLKKRLSNDEGRSMSALLPEKEEEEDVKAEMLRNRKSGSHSDLFGRASFTNASISSAADKMHWKIIEEWAMDDPSIQVIDDYSPKCFGIDIPKRLFWEGYVMRAKDISREPGSEYDTGRPSRASFQDMNFASIKDEFEEDSPRAVVWQYTDPYSPPNVPDPDPMMPQTLLMAYEEHGMVKPVVSDFDCFLLGTRGVRFHSHLPEDQVKMVHQMVDDIEKILKDCTEGRSTNWTSAWLQEMKHHRTQVKMPKYGFGDPKSYAIMKYAVQRLEEFGAVRHGAGKRHFL